MWPLIKITRSITRSMSKLEITICETSAEFAHQFGPLMYQGSRWDLTHLDPFAFQCDLDFGFPDDGARALFLPLFYS
jgi:hypothetical protein